MYLLVVSFLISFNFMHNFTISFDCAIDDSKKISLNFKVKPINNTEKKCTNKTILGLLLYMQSLTKEQRRSIELLNLMSENQSKKNVTQSRTHIFFKGKNRYIFFFEIIDDSVYNFKCFIKHLNLLMKS